jgi:alkanesulfonate monooxygenase SsuD/methylene tetrahydromethanopterin reductase-like flavin-dependent oxidoreductase (luciferase family)
MLIAGNSDKARARAAEFGAGWISIGLEPAEVTASLRQLAQLAAPLGRPTPRATVVAPPLGRNPIRARDQLAEYETAGTERVILPVTSAEWQRDYEYAAQLKAG